MFCLDRFDAQLAQALGECVFEKGLREKVAQENSSTRCELGRLQQLLKVRVGAQCHPGCLSLGLRKPLAHPHCTWCRERAPCVTVLLCQPARVTEPSVPASANRGWQVVDKQALLAPCPSRSCSRHLPEFRGAHLGAHLAQRS